MPYPDAHSHQYTNPDTALDIRRNRISNFVGNAHTARHTKHQTGGRPHRPYELDIMTTEINQPTTLLNDVQAIRGNGYAGWTSPDRIVIPMDGGSQKPDMAIRGVWNNILTTDGEPLLSSEQAWKGTNSFKHIPGLDGTKGRCQLILSAGRVSGWQRMRELQTYFASFVMYDNNPLKVQPWEVYWQCHGGVTAAPAGWGYSASPPISLTRADDNNVYIETRYNKDDGTDEQVLGTPFQWFTQQWQRIVIQWRMENLRNGGKGFYRIWTAAGQNPLQLRDAKDNIPIGMVADDPTQESRHATDIGIYHTTRDASRFVYTDQFRLSINDEATVERMDPLIWDNVDPDGIIVPR